MGFATFNTCLRVTLSLEKKSVMSTELANIIHHVTVMDVVTLVAGLQ